MTDTINSDPEFCSILHANFEIISVFLMHHIKAFKLYDYLKCSFLNTRKGRSAEKYLKIQLDMDLNIFVLDHRNNYVYMF